MNLTQRQVGKETLDGVGILPGEPFAGDEQDLDARPLNDWSSFGSF